jgi:phosphatidylglycerophosphatase A
MVPKNLDTMRRETEIGLHDPQEIQDEFMVSMQKLTTMLLEVKTQELEDSQRTLQKFNKDFSLLQAMEYWAYLTIAFILGVISGIGIIKTVLEK